jgi:hypothetical protein
MLLFFRHTKIVATANDKTTIASAITSAMDPTWDGDDSPVDKASEALSLNDDEDADGSFMLACCNGI